MKYARFRALAVTPPGTFIVVGKLNVIAEPGLVAINLPFTVPPIVTVIAATARIVPWKVPAVPTLIVAELPTTQYIFLGNTPPIRAIVGSSATINVGTAGT